MSLEKAYIAQKLLKTMEKTRKILNFLKIKK